MISAALETEVPVVPLQTEPGNIRSWGRAAGGAKPKASTRPELRAKLTSHPYYANLTPPKPLPRLSFPSPGIGRGDVTLPGVSTLPPGTERAPCANALLPCAPLTAHRHAPKNRACNVLAAGRGAGSRVVCAAAPCITPGRVTSPLLMPGEGKPMRVERMGGVRFVQLAG